MSGHPWRGILKPDRGYVCLSCLLKQHGVRPRRSLRYHSTATQSVTSSITDSGFAVEGGALRNLKGKPSDGVLLPNANAAPQPPKREEPAKEGAKRGKGGRKNAGSNLTEKKADGQTKKPKKADGQTKKPEKGRKGPRRAPGARKGTPNATKGTEQIADVGEASLIEKVEAPDTTDSDAVRGRQIGRRVISRHEQVKSSKPLIRPKVSTLSIRKCSNRLVRDLSKPLIRKHESDDNFVHKVRRYGKTILVGPLQRREALKDLDNISILEEKDEDETSSTLHAASGPRKLSRNVAGIIRGKTSIAKAAELLERAREERLKLKGQGLAAQQKKSTLLTSLKSSLDAQKEALKVKDKAKKVIETKAKGRTKVPKAEKDGESKKSKPKKTVSLTRPAKKSRKGIVAPDHGSPKSTVKKALKGSRSSSKSISEIDGHKPIKEALKGQANIELKGTINSEIHQVEAEDLIIAPIEIARPLVPSLSYGLERVLFNPGVYHIQDPRSRVFNFDPYLQTIMPVAEFDFNALREYITSSRDESLKTIAQEHNKKYVGSSSSMTGALAHFHFLLSQWRQINTSMLSQGFPDKLRTFTALQRCPSAIFLRWKNGTYAIDADKEFDTANVLSMLGKSMEKLLTLPTDDYERYRKSSSEQISNEERNSPESFHYCTIGDFLMRSQLDAHDARLPGTGMFDLKTRAVVSIRMDAKHYQHGVGYQIKTRQGEWESFEREYFDMIRSAFLKYSLQVRMGRMDGIFVAFHNTERIFGFQYVSLPEMDHCLHGQWDTSLGDQEFKLSLNLLNKILDRATKKFPEQTLRIHFETRDVETPFMYIIAEPVTEEQVQEIQSKNKEKIVEFERNILGLHKEDEVVPPAKLPEEDTSKWEEIQAKVEEELENDELSSGIATNTQQPDSMIAVGPSNDAGAEGPPDAPATFDSGPLFAPRSIEAESEKPAASATDQVEEEEEDDDDEDDDGDDGEDEDGEEDEESDDDEERDDAEDDEEEEENVSGTAGEEENIMERDSDTTGAMNEEIAASEPPPDEDINKTSDSKVEQETVDNPQEETATKSKTQGDTAQNDKEQAGAKTPKEFSDLLAMTLTIRNKVNGKYVPRPEKLGASNKWSVEYSLAEIQSQSRAWNLYGACQMRRKKKLDDDGADEEDVAKNYYLRRIRELSERGRQWRNKQDEIEGKVDKVVLDRSSPSNPEHTDGPSMHDG